MPAFADGPAPCSVGGPPFPFAGFCATYSGNNTWYGSYGPGFPTDEGWGFCAEAPASGGDYPSPEYDYVDSGAPAGANVSQADALGFAFSEAQALGIWAGAPGQFTQDQAAVAGKLLYDAVVWASPVPAMDPGVLAAYEDLDGWYVQAVGATGAPNFTASLAGGGSSFAGQANFQVQVSFPGTNDALNGLPVELSITGGTLSTASGPTTVTVATDGSGEATFPIFASSLGPVSVTASVPGGLGQVGLGFLAPTAHELGAQDLTAFSAPSNFTVTQNLTAEPTTGTVSIEKGGDDPAYYPLGGAVFQILSGSNVAATLTTASDGTTTNSPPLTAGVTAGTNAVVSYTGAMEDHVVPSSLSIAKSDAETNAPLAGAVFAIAYDSVNDGTFDQSLGNCTTTDQGTCSPPGNDGSQLLPGRYQVTETGPPPGYAIPDPASQVVQLLAGESGTVMIFGDPKLVSAVFQKVATGNVNPAELVLAGAVIEVDEGTRGGPSVASCTTNPAGTCVMPAALTSGTAYCWVEVLAPPGLVGGANGCFTANNEQDDEPINVSDAGQFVAIQVKKVDAANTSVGLSGASFDLYRVNSVSFSSSMPFPTTPSTNNEVLVATTTTEDGGIGSFPLQLPGYAYCAVETQAPPNYVADTNQQCTGVLAGTTTVPDPITTLTFDDTEQTLTLSVFKYNSMTPGTGIPGAVYDLYVQGEPPPSGATAPAPSGATDETGDTWYARGTTGDDGRLSFTVPAGYGWCVLEVRAPVNYVLDPALHCSTILTTSSDSDASTIAVPETLATVHITAYKYNSRQPNTVIPGATYELLVQGQQPPGTPANPPSGVVVPSGDFFFSEGTTDANGVLTFAVPAGFSWCLHELIAPAAYQADPAYHCTAVLTTDSASAAATVAIPEVPMTNSLAFTGFPTVGFVVTGSALVVGGGALFLFDRRRRTRASR
jgi:uncharacterized surface anchored protein